VLQFPSVHDYSGRIIFVNGKPDRVGRNRISGVPSSVMRYYYDPYASKNTVGADEAYLASGDSGGPSFTVVGGALALLGTHSANTGGPPPVSPAYSEDSFLPSYINWLDGQMTGQQVAVVVPRLGDANEDGVVSIADLSVVLTNYNRTGMTWSKGDFDGNGFVDVSDLSKVIGNMTPAGTAATGLSAVPEPSALVLVAAVAAVALAAKILPSPRRRPIRGRKPLSSPRPAAGMV
jgi:hypothetical protein